MNFLYYQITKKLLSSKNVMFSGFFEGTSQFSIVIVRINENYPFFLFLYDTGTLCIWMHYIAQAHVFRTCWQKYGNSRIKIYKTHQRVKEANLPINQFPSIHTI